MKSEERLLGSMNGARESTPSMPDRLARSLVLKSLGLVSRGHLHLLEPGQCLSFGDHASGLAATIRINSPAFYRQVAFGGTIGAGEAYMDGLWECDDLPALVRIMVRNQEAQSSFEGGLARLTAPLQRFLHRLNDNTRTGSRRNIAAHYDLGNEFYRLFLDPTLAYSCGIFERPDSTMEEASIAKFERICRKLRLEPGMSLLEIGTGWGGFALHAARNFGCQVTTTTISQQQHDHAAARITAAGLADRVTLLQQDYRDLAGQFDRLVSIEMIEAVGHRHLPDFFRVCAGRLKPDGLGLIQAITVPDRIFERYVKSPDFINRYIFPGGCCPSMAAMTRAAASTDLRLVQLEDLTPHYVRTLQQWRHAFHSRLDDVRALGFDERFIRMWDYYLCYCEGGFAERFTGVLQLLYARPECRVEPPLSPLETRP
jgi:cyclopropane-fatty-acyl-phospholipid synthase